MNSSTETEAVAARTIELMGGKERFRQVTDAEFNGMQSRWAQDVETIGRILRAHLYVEHYLTEHIAAMNPHLGSIANARLSFSQKAKLVNPKSSHLSSLKAGIEHLNKLRKRLAHRLDATLTKDDVKVFLQSPIFVSMRFVALGKSPSELEPIEVMEQFAQYAATSLLGEFSEFSQAFSRALSETRTGGVA